MVSKVPVKQLGTFTANVLSAVACDTSVYLGSLVRLDGTGTFINALADNFINSKVFGICVAKSSPILADILLPGGITPSIYSGLLYEQSYFLSPTTAGDMTTIVPTGSGQMILNVGQAYTGMRLLFNPLLQIRRAL